MRKVMIIILLFGFAGTALASGEDWSGLCEKEKIPIVCEFYIAGFVAGHWMTEGSLITMNKDLYERTNFCEPDGHTQKQLVKITLKYIKENPEFLHKEHEALIWDALTEAFPCKKNHLKEKWLDK